MLREGELRELLAAVDLEYLLDREGMDRAVNWHDSLSLGATPLFQAPEQYLPLCTSQRQCKNGRFSIPELAHCSCNLPRQHAKHRLELFQVVL